MKLTLKSQLYSWNQ